MCVRFSIEVVKWWWVIQIIGVMILELPEIVDTKPLSYSSVLNWIRVGRLFVLFIPIEFKQDFFGYLEC